MSESDAEESGVYLGSVQLNDGDAASFQAYRSDGSANASIALSNRKRSNYDYRFSMAGAAQASGLLLSGIDLALGLTLTENSTSPETLSPPGDEKAYLLVLLASLGVILDDSTLAAMDRLFQDRQLFVSVTAWVMRAREAGA